MAIFEYKALDSKGKSIRGIIEVDNAKTARVRLKKEGLLLTEIQEKSVVQKSNQPSSGFTLFGRITISDIATSTRQLASLVKASIPLVDALSALIEQTEKEKLKIVFSMIRQDVNEGSSLAKALSKHPKVFNNVFVNMVEAGESSGTLPLVLIKLADFQEGQVRLKNKILSALMYPLLMMFVALGLLVAIFMFVIPKVVTIFTSMNKPLPLQTQILIAMSNFLINDWWLILIVLVVSFILINRYLATAHGRRRWDSIKLNMPVIGSLIRMLAISRFSSTMATLLTGGVPILSAMAIVKNIVDNVWITDAITQAREHVTEGQSIALPLKRSQQFPPMMIHMIAIGEKTGELPQMLQHLSNTYEEQVSTKIEGLTSLLEPAMIVFMGLIVGGIVMSIFVPLIDLNNISG